MLLNPPTISSKLFNYNAQTKTFVAEASNLRDSFKTGRVYDDVCDEGFTLVSQRTGKSVIFALHHTEVDREGNELWQDFVSVTPYFKGFTVRIFND